MRIVFILLAALIAVARSDHDFTNSPRGEAVQEVIDKILHMDIKSHKPHPGLGNGTEGPTIVHVSVFVRNIHDFDQLKMSYTMELTLIQNWMDGRLKYENPRGLRYVNMPSAESFWRPDLFLPNERGSVKGKEFFGTNNYFRIYPNGQVYLSQRIILTLNCPMDLNRFPLDKQLCPLRLTSYGHNNQDIVFKWRRYDPVQLTSELNLPSIVLEQFTTSNCDVHTSTEIYSCLQVDFCFKREFEFYLNFFYMPSLLLVFVGSLVSWLSVRAILSRVLLSALLLALMMVHNVHYWTQLSHISYQTLLGSWLGVCWMFLGMNLVESIVSYWASPSQSLKRDGESGEMDGNLLNKDDTSVGKGSVSKKMDRVKNWWNKKETIGEQMNFVFRIFYPTVFTIFVVCYLVAATDKHACLCQ